MPWWSRRLLRLGRERAGLHGLSKSPSIRVRTAIGPSRFDWSPALNLTPENATDAPTTSVAPERPLLDHERLDVYGSRAATKPNGVVSRWRGQSYEDSIRTSTRRGHRWELDDD